MITRLWTCTICMACTYSLKMCESHTYPPTILSGIDRYTPERYSTDCTPLRYDMGCSYMGLKQQLFSQILQFSVIPLMRGTWWETRRTDRDNCVKNGPIFLHRSRNSYRTSIIYKMHISYHSKHIPKGT